MKTKHWIIIGVVVLFIAFLYWAGSLSREARTSWEGTTVECLPSGHQQIATHIHPHLSITVDGESEPIPSSIGITSSCMAELHTHDASGQIHVETATADRLNELSFADFFTVWDEPIQRDGYDLSITVDGESVSGADAVPLEDGARIEFAYTTAATSTQSE